MSNVVGALRPALTKRAVDVHNKRDLLEFYLAASSLLTGWVDYQGLVMNGDPQAVAVERAWQRVEQGS